MQQCRFCILEGTILDIKGRGRIVFLESHLPLHWSANVSLAKLPSDSLAALTIYDNVLKEVEDNPRSLATLSNDSYRSFTGNISWL